LLERRARVVASLDRGGLERNATTLDLWRLAHLGRVAPLVTMVKKFVEADEIPPPSETEAACFKLMLGFSDIALSVLLKSGRITYVSAEELYEFANREGRLIGKREVCPAPPALIIRSLQECIDYIEMALSEPKGQAVELEEFAMRFANVHWLLIRFCWAFEVIRLFTLRGIAPASFEASENFRSRFAFPWCDRAREASMESHPLESRFNRSINMLSWNSTKVPLNQAFSDFFETSDIVQKAVLAKSHVSHAWDKLIESALTFLQLADDEVRQCIAADQKTYKYDTGDLEHFFGALNI
jgi:hypothetical protein